MRSGLRISSAGTFDSSKAFGHPDLFGTPTVVNGLPPAKINEIEKGIFKPIPVPAEFGITPCKNCGIIRRSQDTSGLIIREDVTNRPTVQPTGDIVSGKQKADVPVVPTLRGETGTPNVIVGTVREFTDKLGLSMDEGLAIAAIGITVILFIVFRN